MENIQNKTAIVTGGSRGLGNAIANELLRNGARKIVIVDLPIPTSQEGVNTLQKKFGKERVIFCPCDVTKTEDFKETFKNAVKLLDGLDIVVNNAGILNDRMVEHTFHINVVALINSSLMGLDYMGKHKGGKGGTILNIGSISGLNPVHSILIYSASKFAVVAFSRSLQIFYNKTNVRVLTLCPGCTKTNLFLDINNTIDLVDEEDIKSVFHNVIIQSVENVSNAAVNLIEKGTNGAIWAVKDEQPAVAIQIPMTLEEGDKE